jgi:hypothetical protein
MLTSHSAAALARSNPGSGSSTTMISNRTPREGRESRVSRHCWVTDARL